jgi:hypothetical protein
MSAEVVATGEINAWTDGVDAKRGISDFEIKERAHRTCPLGSASCGFAGVEVEPRVDGTGLVDVDALCNRDRQCQNNSERLQAGLNRLGVQVSLRSKAKAVKS